MTFDQIGRYVNIVQVDRCSTNQIELGYTINANKRKKNLSSTDGGFIAKSDVSWSKRDRFQRGKQRKRKGTY